MRWIRNIFLTVLFGLLVRIFVIGIYLVPSASMEPTLLPGDIMLVQKWHFGVSFKRNDIIVFKNKFKPPYSLVKRCIGLPGEAISISDCRVKINGKFLPDVKACRFDFLVLADTMALVTFMQRQGQLRGLDFQISPFSGEVSILNCSLFLVDSLRQKGLIRKIQLMTREAVKTGAGFFEEQLRGEWSLDSMGPISLPERGQYIELNKINYSKYGAIINAYEQVKLKEERGHYFMNDHPAEGYTFKYNYYFVMGDNRQFSDDSRIFGPVPETDIVGKVMLAVYNFNRHGRFGHSIR